jgi:hypothetical protein
MSVIIPTRDRPERLAAGLASVLSQTYRRLEVLVVDDGSSPPVEGVVDRIAAGDRRVRYMRFGSPRGPVAARNHGLARASGDLLAVLDEDYRWLPTKAERQVAFLGDHSEVAAVSCRYSVSREDGRRKARHRGPASCSFEELLWSNFVGSFSHVTCRRGGVLGEVVLDESVASLGDWDLWLRLARHGPIPVIPEVLCHRTDTAGVRASEPDLELRRRKAMVSKYGGEMTESCRVHHEARQRMVAGTGWRHQLAVVRKVWAAESVKAAAVVATEEAALRAGEALGDPGLCSRLVHFLVRASSSPATPRTRETAAGVSDPAPVELVGPPRLPEVASPGIPGPL